MSGRDYRDLTIEDLADEVAALRRDVATYRLAYHAALDRLAALDIQLDRQRKAHDRLVDEYRALRAQTLADARRAA